MAQPYSQDPPRLFHMELWVAGDFDEASAAAHAMARTCGVGIQGPCVLPAVLTPLGHALALQPLEKGYWPKRDKGFMPVGGGLQLAQEEVSQWMTQWRQDHPDVSFLALLRRSDAYVSFDSIVGSLLLDFPNVVSVVDPYEGISLGEFGALGLALPEGLGEAWASVNKNAQVGQTLLPVLLSPSAIAYLRQHTLQGAFAPPALEARRPPSVSRF